MRDVALSWLGSVDSLESRANLFFFFSKYFLNENELDERDDGNQHLNLSNQKVLGMVSGCGLTTHRDPWAQRLRRTPTTNFPNVCFLIKRKESCWVVPSSQLLKERRSWVADDHNPLEKCEFFFLFDGLVQWRRCWRPQTFITASVGKVSSTALDGIVGLFLLFLFLEGGVPNEMGPSVESHHHHHYVDDDDH